jgi:isoleucyl-tRNA synthetase
MKAMLKRRWPLAEAYVCLSSRDDLELINSSSSLLDTLRVQMNVETVHIKYVDINDEGNNILSKCKRILALIDQGLPLKASIVFNVKSIAKKVKGDIQVVLEHLNRADSIALIRELCNNNMLTVSYNEKSVIISIEDVSDVKYEPSEGYTLSSNDSILVILSTSRDKRLIAKGLVRDIARRLQALRKEKGYNPTDVVEHAYIAGLDGDAVEMLNPMKDELAYLVRARDVSILSMNEAEEVSKSKGIKFVEVDIDGKQVMLYI